MIDQHSSPSGSTPPGEPPAADGGGLDRRARSPWTRRLAVALTALAVVAALGGGFWAWSALSETRYDAARSVLGSQLADEVSAVHAYNARLTTVAALATRVGSVVDRPEFTADTGAEAATLRQDLAVLEPFATAPAAPEPAAPPTPDGGTAAGGFTPPWQVIAESEALEERTRESRSDTDRLAASLDATKSAGDAASASEAAYFGAAATTAEQLIAANALSNRSAQVTLLDLVDEARNPGMGPRRDGAFLGSMFEAEAAVVSSQNTNQAEENDPAWAVRREIEAYARSLSNGVALEFVWAPEVNGLGEDWLSGSTVSYEPRGGYAIISLNYSIEEGWNDGLNDTDARALVAHEVGHTQVFRCAKLFADPAFGQDQEMWATAWSISLGYDVEGSGIQAYGRPTDQQIEVAGQCR